VPLGASSRVRNLPQRVSYLGEKRLDPPVQLWYHVCTWSHRVRGGLCRSASASPRQTRGWKESCPSSWALGSYMEFRRPRTRAPAYAAPLQSCWRAGCGWVPGPGGRATGCAWVECALVRHWHNTLRSENAVGTRQRRSTGVHS
jgi:hypothetical protein